MKNLIKTVVAVLCTALSIAFAQTSPPMPVIPDHLSIGKMAIAEALAKVYKVEVVTTAPTMVEEYRQILIFESGVDSRGEIIDRLVSLDPGVEVNDPKDTITTTVVIYTKDDKKLFVGMNSFKMEKVGYDEAGKSIYQYPFGAGFMVFDLMADPIAFPGATFAWAVDYSGYIQELQCYDGKIVMPNWMNLSNISEIVVNGNWRYDMNTGLLLTPQDGSRKIENAYFAGTQTEVIDMYGVLTVYTQPMWGYANLTEFNNQEGKFHLEFSNGYPYQYNKPVAVRITTLDDLRNDRGWKIYNFPEGGLDLDIPVGTYYVLPEYNPSDFGWGIPTTPNEG